MSKITKIFKYGDHQVSLETGAIARQASGAVMVRMGDTVVLATVVGVASQEPRAFFPLTVNYQERTYAAGKIPGGYFKREGRPTERETLISRLIDRPLRPLFPTGFTDEVQIVVTLLSLDPKVDPEIPAIIGASAALAVSGIPFIAPIAAAKIGYKEGVYLLNYSSKQQVDSALELVVAGTEHAVLMVESEAKELSEETMLGAVMFGHQQMQVVIQAIKALAEEASKSGWDWRPTEANSGLQQLVRELVEQQVRQTYQIPEKLERKKQLANICTGLVERLCCAEENAPTPEIVKKLFGELEEHVVRNNILDGQPRIDGRDNKTVRPIYVETGLLPRTHGSALFTRGETQSIVVATLGTEKDSQVIDDLGGEYRDIFMLHYNFPPYSVGEVGQIGSPKRREIGHGRLAKRALQAVMPTLTEFPYVIRLVSEITESNGSSSMATVCGGSLSLMDAGVPIKAPVAGIAMGLIKEGNRFAIISDILGDEDHLGDMDFKVAGTENGITALQMDIKIEGITQEIMQHALAQAKEGRLHILQVMKQGISAPRPQISNYAPRITTMKINADKIREVIGKGGAVIREITESTGTVIDISDEGVIKIAAIDTEAAIAARSWIERIVAEVEVGSVYSGTVVKIAEFGAFVAILGNKQGLVHISQIAHERVGSVQDKLKEGQVVRVKVLEIDRQGRIRLSMKDVEV